MMKRASYREAVRWIIENDDTEWLDEEPSYASVTAILVANLFDVSKERIEQDLRRERNKTPPEGER
jgi:hypothetical protein